MKKTTILSTAATAFLLLSGAVANAQLRAGSWRGVFYNRNGSEVPFNFEVKGTAANPKVYLINGPERVPADKVVIKKDSIIIPIDQFDNELAFKIENGNRLVGVLRRQDERTPPPVDTKGLPISVDRTGLPLKVVAEFGKTYRFTAAPAKPAFSLAGKWDVVYTTEDGNDVKTVGIFEQTGTKISGTFLKTTGDARFLAGDANGKKFGLSSFIGTGPNLITASFTDANTFIGESRLPSGNFKVRGTRNAKAELPDAYSLTHLKTGYKTFNFNLPDVNGKKVALQDAQFKNKPIILTITGTWCPNCMDEAAFLAPWYKKNKSRGIEVVSVYYERKDDPAYITKVLTRVKKKYGIEYHQLVGGLADKKYVAESLPWLEKFLAFPTTIFIDRKGNVAKIHTGYNGPATGKYYNEFKAEFDKEANALLAN